MTVRASLWGLACPVALHEGEKDAAGSTALAACYQRRLYLCSDARRLAARYGVDDNYWHNVRRYLPLLEDPRYNRFARHGHARGKEPVIYVGNIRRFYDALRWEPLRQALTSTASPAVPSN